MLVCIPDVLEWTELKKIRATITDATFVDGGRTAGYRARRVKNNEQMDKDSKAASEIKATIAPPCGAMPRSNARRFPSSSGRSS